MQSEAKDFPTRPRVGQRVHERRRKSKMLGN
jgi:hypothetical protein